MLAVMPCILPASVGSPRFKNALNAAQQIRRMNRLGQELKVVAAGPGRIKRWLRKRNAPENSNTFAFAAVGQHLNRQIASLTCAASPHR